MPTLFRLEQKFREQTQEREEAKGRTRLAIDWSLAKSGGGFAGFRQWLERERLSAVLTNRRPGHGEEIIFVDFNSRQAFRGDELGLRYTSPEIGQRLAARSLQIRAVAQAALKISRLLDASPVRVEGISRNEAVGKEDQPPLQLPARLVQGAGLPPAHGSWNESQIL